ncbi:hypothetical protein AGRA3207_005312 [Actinomadura graeca]|uniref:Uncharacterized protein n=1 Tax=Actinomadura graeca TaxID=2750812 RepID=A0ABX8QZ17_9ACTN|nr:hypothetical protein [Actinomadura graeca]QXJ24061.1 hypothetical protein AGRA3207_005312 [Actinomadura graeca]
MGGRPRRRGTRQSVTKSEVGRDLNQTSGTIITGKGHTFHIGSPRILMVLSVVSTVLAVTVIGGFMVLRRSDAHTDAHTSVTVPPKAVVTFDEVGDNSVVPMAPGHLPSPPDYPPADENGHCQEWKSWFDRLAGAPITKSRPIRISAPAHANVEVVSAKPTVYRSYKPARLTLVRCQGAGPKPGTLLRIDLDHPVAPPTVVADDGSEKPLRMPNATIAINAGHTEYVAVTPRAAAAKMVEWSVRITMVIDQKEQVVNYGSAGRPLRNWFGPPPPAQDWDQARRTWT